MKRSGRITGRTAKAKALRSEGVHYISNDYITLVLIKKKKKQKFDIHMKDFRLILNSNEKILKNL